MSKLLESDLRIRFQVILRQRCLFHLRSRKSFSNRKNDSFWLPIKSNCFEAPESSLDVEGQNVLEHSLPVLLVTGGGNGSALLNDFVKENLNELTRDHLVIHQIGKNQLDEFTNLKVRTIFH